MRVLFTAEQAAKDACIIRYYGYRVAHIKEANKLCSLARPEHNSVYYYG
jgi:hypothetical protein